MEISPEQVRAILRSTLREQVIANAPGVNQLSNDPSSLSDAVLRAIADDALEVLINFGDEVEMFEAEQSKGIYSVDIVGVDGAYYVRATEFDDKGVFSTLEEARSTVQRDHGEFLVTGDRIADDEEGAD